MKQVIKCLKVTLLSLVKLTVMYFTFDSILLLYLVLNYRTAPITIYFFSNTLFIFLVVYFSCSIPVFADKYGNYIVDFLIELAHKIGRRLSKGKK